MKRQATIRLNFGGPQTVIFILLVAFILGGNGLLVWQFRIARERTDHLAVMSRQMTAILRLQYSLVSYHQKLDELVDLRDPRALGRESELLQTNLIEQIRKTKDAISASPSDRRLEARLLPLLDAMEIGFPHQLQSITAVAAAGDWGAVTERVAARLQPTEIEVTAFAKEIDDAFTAERARSEQNAVHLQNRILFLIPFMAISTFSLAALFVWLNAQRIIELRFEERLSERMRITRDLHDTFLQTIQGSKLFAENTLAKCSDVVGMRDAIGQLARWLDRATEEGRSALNSLRSTHDDRQNLADVLRAVTLDARAQGPMKVMLSISGQPFGLAPELKDEVVRIAREAITNARKHSLGRQAEVKLEYADCLSIIVSDDGKGFDPTDIAAVPNGHYGLRAMRERAAHIGGKLTITSSATSGTQVKLVLPRRSLLRSGNDPGLPSKFVLQPIRLFTGKQPSGIRQVS